jgi:adenine/guanine phosphoribosyltransferase-like PRPP-binding protein
MESRFDRLPYQETLSIAEKELILRNYFLKEARIIDYDKGYISVPFVNQLVDPKLQGIAADLIIEHISQNEIPIDKVVQIPYSGNSLAYSVAERLDTPLVLGRKGNDSPGAWKNQFIINETTESFTTGKKSSFVFNELYPRDNVYLIDDVIANGDTSSLIIKEFEKRGIIVNGMSIYFAKLFQPGIEKVYNETGIDPFYAIGVEEISEKGIKLAPPHFYKE